MTTELVSAKDAPLNEACNSARAGLLRLLQEFCMHIPDTVDTNSYSTVSPAFTTIEIDDWEEARVLWSSVGLPLLADVPPRACPVCDSSMSHAVFQSYDGYYFKECERCGTWYVPLSVDWALFERFFTKCPPARAIAERATTGRMEQSDNPDNLRFGNYFRSVLDLLTPSRSKLRYLDIGCGVGHSLTAAKSAGMLPHGVEADPDAVALAKRNHEIVVSCVEDLPLGAYDVISMWETLEHLADPLLMLREAVTRLLPGGLVAVTVPNLDALAVRILREKCSYAYGGYNSPGHINFFNRRTIQKLFERAGLTLVEVSYEFSSNPLELFGYLGGLIATDRPYALVKPPQLVAEILNAIWPAITLVEEFASTLPIMHCIACRPEDVSLFSKKSDERSSIRRQRLIAAAPHQLAALGDPVQHLREQTEQYIKMHDHLQSEIDKRDALLKETHDHLQGEVNKRDEMLAELQRQLNER